VRLESDDDWVLRLAPAQDKDESSNVVHVGESFYFRGHLCICFELLSLNLYEFVKNNNFQGLSLGLIRRFAQQILVSLRYLRQHKIIHCDLKPENILLKGPNKSAIKVRTRSEVVLNTQMRTRSSSHRLLRDPDCTIATTQR
jgi:serine/threonine protein kinase